MLFHCRGAQGRRDYKNNNSNKIKRRKKGSRKRNKDERKDKGF